MNNRIHLVNTFAFMVMAALFGWLFTMAGTESAARHVLFYLAISSIAIAVLSCIAAFTEVESVQDQIDLIFWKMVATPKAADTTPEEGSMFTHRCISCTMKLSDGLPPLEALDFSQRIGVGTTDGTGLRLDGTSGYQYCTFCLLFEEEYGTMDKEEHPHYQFSDLGRTKWIDFPDSIGEYYDPVFANWNIMLYTAGVKKADLPNDLLLMWIDRHDYVASMEEQIEKDRQKMKAEAAKIHNRIKSFFRHLYFKAWEKVPYHLLKGLRLLKQAALLPRDMSEDEQDYWYEVLAEEGQIWHYENRMDAPFAKFELWARGVLERRFFHRYDY